MSNKLGENVCERGEGKKWMKKKWPKKNTRLYHIILQKYRNVITVPKKGIHGRTATSRKTIESELYLGERALRESSVGRAVEQPVRGERKHAPGLVSTTKREGTDNSG